MVEEKLAGQVIAGGRICHARRAGCLVEIVDDVDLGLLSILVGKRNADVQSGNATVPGNQAPGDFLRAERDRLNSFYIGIAQGRGIVDERLDDQLVFEAFAVGVVGDRIDASDIGGAPEQLGHLFQGDQRFPRENGAVLRRYGKQRGVGERVGVLHFFERDEVRVVLAEVIAKVDVDIDDVLGTRDERQYDKQGE